MNATSNWKENAKWALHATWSMTYYMLACVHALPSWLTIQVSRRFFHETHVWKHKFYALDVWAFSRSSITLEFDTMMGVILMCLFLLAAKLSGGLP